MVKVERTQQAPASLAIEKQKVSGKYNLPDVVNLLYHDFNGKCYICEIDKLQSSEVEHLKPHHNGQFRDRKFDWNNLFLICPHCNSVKNQDKYNDLIIDCCQKDPEQVLVQELIEGHVHVSLLIESPEAEATAKLIEECFEYTNTAIRTKECEVRIEALQTVMTVLCKQLAMYRKNKTPRTEKTLRGMLDRKYKFAGFTRTYVRNHLDCYPELKQYVL